ncbi:NAD-dependent deacetylase hst3 [Saitoella coloradoensis]
MVHKISLAARGGGSKVDRDLDEVAHAVAKAKRVMVVTGAGISCNAGIPDFRSSDGLYNLALTDSIKGKDLFDISLFNKPETTSTFYTFTSNLRRAILDATPTPTHRFIRTLKDKSKLLRCYTQNIDGLETREGLVDGEDVVQLHGDIHSLVCTLCQQKAAWTPELMEELRLGSAPSCLNCESKSLARTLSGKRGLASGVLRPNIVLYGEEHPQGPTLATLINRDLRRRIDCLLVIGTSLRIPGFKKLVKDAAQIVHSYGGKVVFVNLGAPSVSEWRGVMDWWVEGDSDGWVEDLRIRAPEIFRVQTTLDGVLKSTKPGIKTKIKNNGREPTPSESGASDKENEASVGVGVGTPKKKIIRQQLIQLPTPPSSQDEACVPASVTRKRALVEESCNSPSKRTKIISPKKKVEMLEESCNTPSKRTKTGGAATPAKGTPTKAKVVERPKSTFFDKISKPNVTSVAAVKKAPAAGAKRENVALGAAVGVGVGVTSNVRTRAQVKAPLKKLRSSGVKVQA